MNSNGHKNGSDNDHLPPGTTGVRLGDVSHLKNSINQRVLNPIDEDDELDEEQVFDPAEDIALVHQSVLDLELFNELQVEVNERLAIENADGFRFACHAICLGAQFIVDIATQPVKTVFSVFISDIGTDFEGLAVLEQDHRTWSRRARFGKNGSFDGSGSRCSRRGAYHGRLNLCRSKPGRGSQNRRH